MGLLAEKSFKVCAVLIIVCSAAAAEDKSVTIIRRLGKSDVFNFAKSINKGELPTQCTTFGGNPLVASEPTKDCTCKNRRQTFGYFDNKWRCMDHDEYFARNISGSKGCKLSIKDKRVAVVRDGIWSSVRLWSYHDGNCKIDWKGSSMLQCHSSLTPLSKNPVFSFYASNKQYFLKVETIPREMHGRVLKLAIRCRSDSRSSHHCLMLKMEGKLKCPLKHVTESTTPISTTSLLSLTATTETEVTTRPTTRVAVKKEKRAGSRNNVPVAAIAGGVAAAMVLVAVLIVCLILKQKNKRKSGESFTQGGQLEQSQNEPTERRYCLARNKRPSLVGYRDSPVYERVLNRDSNSEDPTDDGRISPLIHDQFSRNPEYECVRTAETETSRHENEDKKLLSSEHYDYAKPEGAPEKNTDQNGWYDVPECEIGTIKTLPVPNYYDVAGSVIAGETTHLNAHPGQQDENDGVTVNPLYGAF